MSHNGDGTTTAGEIIFPSQMAMLHHNHNKRGGGGGAGSNITHTTKNMTSSSSASSAAAAAAPGPGPGPGPAPATTTGEAARHHQEDDTIIVMMDDHNNKEKKKDAGEQDEVPFEYYANSSGGGSYYEEVSLTSTEEELFLKSLNETTTTTTNNNNNNINHKGDGIVVGHQDSGDMLALEELLDSSLEDFEDEHEDEDENSYNNNNNNNHASTSHHHSTTSKMTSSSMSAAAAADQYYQALASYTTPAILAMTADNARTTTKAAAAAAAARSYSFLSLPDTAAHHHQQQQMLQDSPRTKHRKQVLESDEFVSEDEDEDDGDGDGDDDDDDYEGAEDIDSLSASSKSLEDASMGSDATTGTSSRGGPILSEGGTAAAAAAAAADRDVDFYDDDITDDEEDYGDDDDDDDGEEFYYEEIELPDIITPIRKIWRKSMFFTAHWTRMEQISEGEEEDERSSSSLMKDEDEGGNESDGSISLKGDSKKVTDKGGNDLDKSWGSLDSHKRSWHSSHSRAAVPKREHVSPSRVLPPDEVEALMPLRSPRSKSKRGGERSKKAKPQGNEPGDEENTQGNNNDEEDESAATAAKGNKKKSSSTKPRKSKSAEKSALNKEYAEEHNLNDSLRGNRTAVLKAKKKRDVNRKKGGTKPSKTKSTSKKGRKSSNKEEATAASSSLTTSSSDLIPKQQEASGVTSSTTGGQSPTKDGNVRSDPAPVSPQEPPSATAVKTKKSKPKRKTSAPDSSIENDSSVRSFSKSRRKLKVETSEAAAPRTSTEQKDAETDSKDAYTAVEKSKSKSSRRLNALAEEEEAATGTVDSPNNSARSKSKSKQKSKAGSERTDSKHSSRSKSKSRRKLRQDSMDTDDENKSSGHSRSKSRRKLKTSSSIDGESTVADDEDSEKPKLRRGRKPVDDGEQTIGSKSSPNKRTSKSPRGRKSSVSKDVKDLVSALGLLDDLSMAADDSRSKHSFISEDASKSSRKRPPKSPKSPKGRSKSIQKPGNLKDALSLLDEKSVSKRSSDGKDDEDTHSKISFLSNDASKSSQRRKSKSPKPRKNSVRKAKSMRDLRDISEGLLDDDSKTIQSFAESSTPSKKTQKPKSMLDLGEVKSPKRKKPKVKSQKSQRKLTITTEKDEDDDTASLEQPDSTSLSNHKAGGAAISNASIQSLSLDSPPADSDETAQATSKNASKRSNPVRNLGAMILSPRGTASWNEKNESAKVKRTRSMFSRAPKTSGPDPKDANNETCSSDEASTRKTSILRALLSPIGRSRSFARGHRKKGKGIAIDNEEGPKREIAESAGPPATNENNSKSKSKRTVATEDDMPFDEAASEAIHGQSKSTDRTTTTNTADPRILLDGENGKNLRSEILTEVQTLVEDGLAKAREAQKRGEEEITKEISKLKEAVESTVGQLNASFARTLSFQSFKDTPADAGDPLRFSNHSRTADATAIDQALSMDSSIEEALSADDTPPTSRPFQSVSGTIKKEPTSYRIESSEWTGVLGPAKNKDEGRGTSEELTSTST